MHLDISRIDWSHNDMNYSVNLLVVYYGRDYDFLIGTQPLHITRVDLTQTGDSVQKVHLYKLRLEVIIAVSIILTKCGELINSTRITIRDE